jgi:large repetitive protein
LPSGRQKVLPVVFSFFLIATGATLRAQNPAQAAAGASDSSLVLLKDTHHPLAVEENAVGRVEGDRTMPRMVLVLAPSDLQEAQLQQLLDDQQNRRSQNYHHWLSAAEFGARFGAADADVQNILGWLQDSGFSVEGVSSSKRWVVFNGTASQVEDTFHTVMKYYRWNGKTFIANSTDLAIPGRLSSITRGVLSLNNFGKSPPIHQFRGTAGRDAQGLRTKLEPNLTASGSTNTYYVAPGDFAAIYDTNGLLNSGVDGTGVTIAVTAQSQIELTDVQEFRKIFGLKANDPNFLLSGPDPGIADQIDAEEALLDVEWAGAVAPGATIDLVVAGSTDTTSGVDLAAAYVIDNEVAPILSYTYGTCEQALGSTGNAFYKALWQQAAVEGITVFVSSGDNGAAGCDSAASTTPAADGMAVNGMASTPYDVAVGGTQFAEGTQAASYWNASNAANYSSAIGYIPEATWNESCDPALQASSTNCVLGTGNFSMMAGAGGASTVYPKPSWQTGTGVPADKARDLPDLSLAAASGHDEAVYCTSLAGSPCQINAQQEVVGLTLVGGTSLSTPSMAGILALVEQKNGAMQGQINYTLYRLAQGPGSRCDSSSQTNPKAQNSCVFYDITAGNNEVPCAGSSSGCSSTQVGTDGFTTGQVAGPGYDLATGLGSVNATNLAAAWTSITLTASETTLQASSTSFAHGTAVTLNGAVTPATGTGSPTGAVSIKTDLYGNSQQIISLITSGTFSGSVTDLPGGQYNVHAYYAGDATYASSESSGIAVHITPENSSTTLAITGLQNSAAGYGTPLQLKATTAGVSGQGVPTGTITIQDGATSIGSCNLASDGTAYLLTGGGAGYAFAPGPHSLTAVYSGDNSFDASTSSAMAFTIAKGTPFVVVGVNTASLAAGQTLGAHAVVAGQGTAAATGTIQFTVDGAVFGTPIPLQTGGFFGTQAQASLLIPNLPQGTHVIGATYNATYNGSADPNYNSVNSGDPMNELTQSVTVAASSGTSTTTVLKLKTAPVNLGDTGVFTATITPSTATGTVTLWDAVGPRTAASSIAGGTATVQFVWTQAGSTSVYAVYSGDSKNAGSSSSPVAFTVQKGTPQITLAVPSTVSSSAQISLNATVTGNPANPQLPYPVGIVEFWDSFNGAAAQLLTSQSLTAGPGGTSVYGARLQLAPGAHSLYVHYRGDTNWQAANSATVPLTASTFTLSVAPNIIAFVAGTPGTGTVTVTPSGGFSGSVMLTCPSGGSFLPSGYTCALGQSTLTVSNAPASTTLTLVPSSASASSALKPARVAYNGFSGGIWGAAFGAAILLLSIFGFGAAGSQNSRNFFVSAGLLLCVGGIVLGCGGGGGGGGGPVSSTTTIVSSNLRIAFGMPVTFTVTVKPNGSVTPSGQVQLYDNGQALGGPANVSAGIATFSSMSLPPGVHNLTAQYLGNTQILGSTSAPIAQIITGSVSLQISGAASGISQTADFTAQVN